MSITPHGYVSVIGVALGHPLVQLVEQLISQPVVPPNEVQTSQRENGYAMGIIVLAVLLLESALHRTCYVREERVERDMAAYFQHLHSGFELVAAVHEVFALRDAIVHNHIWEAQIVWAPDGSLRLEGIPQIREGYGNRCFYKVLEPQTRLSHQLRLHLFPPQIFRRDAFVVLHTIVRALAALEAMDRNYFCVSMPIFPFHGRLMTLPEIVETLDYV